MKREREETLDRHLRKSSTWLILWKERQRGLWTDIWRKHQHGWFNEKRERGDSVQTSDEIINMVDLMKRERGGTLDRYLTKSSTWFILWKERERGLWTDIWRNHQHGSFYEKRERGDSGQTSDEIINMVDFINRERGGTLDRHLTKSSTWLIWLKETEKGLWTDIWRNHQHGWFD